MATIFTRTSKEGYTKYYGNLTVNSKRIKQYLADNPKSARIALKKHGMETRRTRREMGKRRFIP